MVLYCHSETETAPINILTIRGEKAKEPYERNILTWGLKMLDGQRETPEQQKLRRALEDGAKGRARKPLPELERPPQKRFYQRDSKVDKCWKAQ
jgi:hypothetical protein